ncbi:hypothetical protein [Nocardia carnea]|uniref:hypothetical protein n=1 Tax=Nocardia carnea TaxID=37328 RepID=UPI0024566B5E|nr:hypothetical protein [Nocardia carnea]
MNTADSANFVADDEFEAAEDFFPFAPVQQWAALNTDIDESALAVLTYTMCHLNPLTGKFDANFGRKRVAERFGRSTDWVDKQYKTLIKAGAMTKQAMYWIDPPPRQADAPRTTERMNPETGKKREQAPNRWRVRMSPPGGAAYPGPVNIGEYYRTERVGKRLASQGIEGVAAHQRPRPDQRKRHKTPGQRVAAPQRPRVAAPQRPPVAAPQRPKLSSKGTTAGRKAEAASSSAPATTTTPPERPACLPAAEPKNTPGTELLASLPGHLATAQVIRQHARTVGQLLDSGWTAEALRRRLLAECDGNAGPGRLVTAIRDIPAQPPQPVAEQPEPAPRPRHRPDCVLCGGDGWVLDDDRSPIVPAVRCHCPE